MAWLWKRKRSFSLFKSWLALRPLLKAKPLASEPLETIPHHVAIIMDGNGRWARRQRKLPSFGHKEGARRVEQVVQTALQSGVKHLTLFAMSQENTRRPAEELNNLFNVLQQACCDLVDHETLPEGVRLAFIGSQEGLPESVCQSIQKSNGYLRGSTERMRLWIAFNYSGQWDFTQAALQWMKHSKQESSTPTQTPSLESAQRQLLTYLGGGENMPAVDLLIRTGGEYRISNFMLWHLAYAELYFSNALWPDFSPSHWQDALGFFARRERRFGERLS